MSTQPLRAACLVMGVRRRGKGVKRVTKRWVFITGACVAFGLIWWGHPVILTQVALFLVVDEPLTKPADVIIVTSGSLQRIQYAVALYQEDLGGALLININPEGHEVTSVRSHRGCIAPPQFSYQLNRSLVEDQDFSATVQAYHTILAQRPQGNH